MVMLADPLSQQEEMDLHCSDSDTPLTISEAQWMAYQSNTTSTPTSTSSSAKQTVTVTGTSTPTPDPNDEDDEDSGLSSGARIGIIAGSAAAGVALLAAALFFFMRHRRRRHHDRDQAQPMLPSNTPQELPNEGALSSAFPNSYSGDSSSANPGHVSMGPSELESAPSTMGSPTFRGSWVPSPEASSVPWSPGAFESVKAAHIQSLHQPPPRSDLHEIYEMAGDTGISPSPPPHPRSVDMPSIAVTSPTVSPSSRYSGVHWGSEQSASSESEPRQYEPFRHR